MRRTRPESERFWEKVLKTETCWLWQGAKTATGYGLFIRSKTGKYRVAHRWSYETAKGPIPEGLELDHLCRVRNCVRPDHLEAVTHTENMRRAVWKKNVLCRFGHEITGEGRLRACPTCRNRRMAAYRARIKSERSS